MSDYDDLESRLAIALSARAEGVRGRPGAAAGARRRATGRRRGTATMLMAAVATVAVAVAAVSSRRPGAASPDSEPSVSNQAPPASVSRIPQQGDTCAGTSVRIEQRGRTWDLLTDSRIGVDRTFTLSSAAPATLVAYGPCADDADVLALTRSVARTIVGGDARFGRIASLEPGPLILRPGTTEVRLLTPPCLGARDAGACLGPILQSTFSLTVNGPTSDACVGTVVAIQQGHRDHVLYADPDRDRRRDRVIHLDFAAQGARVTKSGPCDRDVVVTDASGHLLDAESRGVGSSAGLPLPGGPIFLLRGDALISVTTPDLCAHSTTDQICEGGPGELLAYRVRIS